MGNPGLPLGRERLGTAVEVERSVDGCRRCGWTPPGWEGAAGLGAAAWALGAVSIRLEAGAGGARAVVERKLGHVEVVLCSGGDAAAD